jgi:hypothetical protein
MSLSPFVLEAHSNIEKLSFQSVDELKMNPRLLGRFELGWSSGDPLSSNMDRSDKLQKFIGQIVETEK